MLSPDRHGWPVGHRDDLLATRTSFPVDIDEGKGKAQLAGPGMDSGSLKNKVAASIADLFPIHLLHSSWTRRMCRTTS